MYPPWVSQLTEGSSNAEEADGTLIAVTMAGGHSTCLRVRVRFLIRYMRVNVSLVKVATFWRTVMGADHHPYDSISAGVLFGGRCSEKNDYHSPWLLQK